MTSEIRTNTLTSRAGLSTVTLTDSGPMFSGITTFVDNSGFTFGVGAGSSIFTPASNTLTFGTNSNERVRIVSNGDIGFNDTSPTAHASGNNTVLSIKGKGSSYSGKIDFKDSSGNLDNYINSDNSVLQFYCDPNSQNGNTSMLFYVHGGERFRFGRHGQLGIAGANYGSSGQVLTSGGSGSAATWSTITGTTINNNASNRIITGEGGTTLNGEAELTFANKVLDFQQNNNSTNTINGTLQFSNVNHSVAKIEGYTRTTEDDGDIRFYTKNSGTFAEGLRLSFHTEPKLQMLAGETEIVSSASDGSLVFRADPGQNRSNSYIGFNIDASERMSITSTHATLYGATDGVLNLDTTDSRGSFIRFQQGGATEAWVGCGQGLSLGGKTTLAFRSDADIRIRTGTEEHATITTNGYLAVKGQAGNWIYGNHPSNYSFHQFSSSKNGDWMMQFRQEHFNGLGFNMRVNNNNANEAIALYRESQGNYGFKVYNNGNVQNINNSYGSLSDVSLKENIVDAKSQWNDIKGIKVRNFNLKSDTDKVKMLGVVAQELESVSPNLVFEDKEGIKGVHYSVLYMKAIKALQEAMTRIETLEQENIALRARVTNLEGE